MDIANLRGAQAAGNAGVASYSRQEGSAPVTPAAAPVTAQPSNTAPSQEQLKSTVAQMNQLVQNMPHGTNLEFTVDDDTKINVIKVVDKTTNEVIRQFPSEELLSIAKAIDRLQGLIIRQNA